MLKQIFLISGEAESGKDATANLMMNMLYGKSVKTSFAFYLKIIAETYFGWNGEKDEEGRQLLQWLGTDVIHEILGREFHVKRICEDIKIIENTYDYVFIPDTRFKHEVFYTKAMFPYHVTTIRVHRPYHQNKLTPEQRNHISEVDLNNFKHDYYVANMDDGLYGLKESIYRKSGLAYVIDGLNLLTKG